MRSDLRANAYPASPQATGWAILLWPRSPLCRERGSSLREKWLQRAVGRIARDVLEETSVCHFSERSEFLAPADQGRDRSEVIFLHLEMVLAEEVGELGENTARRKRTVIRHK